MVARLKLIENGGKALPYVYSLQPIVPQRRKIHDVG